MTPEDRLSLLGLTLPSAQAPLASYVPARQHNGILHLSGQGPLKDGAPTITGQVGGDVTLEQGIAAARLTALNALAALKAALGDLSRIVAVQSLTAYVASAPGFHSQHLVMNGASDLLVEVLGEAGRHARVAVGTNALPMNLPVELSMIVAVTP
ncbi:LysR family transcriptional regulator [Pararhodobacter marinus]|uniref:LysR family transcriptional regulator n=1 Tax=Pararhodobacter marinus TaxID=2184063 RepID=A0A2U2C6Q4_9RHOB|nr:RidA family protein [Pararhodobacter marinus]PWE27521.1 LysR family transcriptional regulator [Pararhodobacter marinus]